MASSFSIEFDVWNATLKPVSTTPTFARFGIDARDSPPQTSPSGFRAAVLDLQSQSSSLSPRLLVGNSKAHHRQTSIVHGIQHSRNGSLASTSSSSPLSPQMILAAGGSENASMGDSSGFAPSLAGMNNGASFSSSSTLLPERTSSAADSNNNYNLTQKRVERMHSGRSSRDHRHHHSHSRHHHKDELKTVGEYALHVLFTSVGPSICTSLRPVNNAYSSLPKPKRKYPSVSLYL